MEDAVDNGYYEFNNPHNVGNCEDFSTLSCSYFRSIGVPAKGACGIGNLEGDNNHEWTLWYDSYNEKWMHLDTVQHGSYDAKDKSQEKFVTYVTVDYNPFVGYFPLLINQMYTNEVNTVFNEVSISSSGSDSLDFELIDANNLKVGEDASIKVKFNNIINEERSYNLTLELFYTEVLIGHKPEAISTKSYETIVQANSTQISNFTLSIPYYATSGNYSLIISDTNDPTSYINEQVFIVPNFEVNVSPNENIKLGEPFDFTISIKNNCSEDIHNLTASLNLHSQFICDEQLDKSKNTLDSLEECSFSWNLTPIEYGNSLLELIIYSDKGIEREIIDLQVNSQSKIIIVPDTPENVESGTSFILNAKILNAGDLLSDAILLEIFTPDGVESNITSLNVGSIDAHENKTCAFYITQDEADDFSILFNASTSSGASMERYAFVNIVQPSMYVDLLTEGELTTEGQHTSEIEVFADEYCNLTLHIANNGDEILHNIVVSSNMGMNSDLGNIEAGESISVPFGFIPQTPGINELVITVSSDELSKEIRRTLVIEKFEFEVAIPQILYDPQDTVLVNCTVKNEVPDIRFVDIGFRINISGSNYTKSFNVPLLSLAPSETKSSICTWNTANANNGTYLITSSLMLANEAIISETNEVFIGINLPDINFTADPVTGYAPLDVQFMNNCTGNITEYEWDFGDGSTSHEQNPLHTYNYSGTYTVTLQVTNIEGSFSKTLEDYITVSNQNSASVVSSGGGGGGGGGGGTTGEKFENIAYKDVLSEFVSKGDVTSYEFDDEQNAIESIRFQASRNWGKISSTIEMLHDRSALVDEDAPDTVYRNVNLWVGKSGFSENIEETVVGFKVEKDWVEENNIDVDTIRLCRYSDGQWSELDTEKLSEDDTYLHFEASTPGFSPFAIVGTSFAQETVEDVEERMSVEDVEGNTTVEEGAVSTEPKGAFSGLFAIGFASIVLVGGIVVLAYRKRD